MNPPLLLPLHFLHFTFVALYFVSISFGFIFNPVQITPPSSVINWNFQKPVIPSRGLPLLPWRYCSVLETPLHYEAPFVSMIPSGLLTALEHSNRGNKADNQTQWRNCRPGQHFPPSLESLQGRWVALGSDGKGEIWKSPLGFYKALQKLEHGLSHVHWS